MTVKQILNEFDYLIDTVESLTYTISESSRKASRKEFVKLTEDLFYKIKNDDHVQVAYEFTRKKNKASLYLEKTLSFEEWLWVFNSYLCGYYFIMKNKRVDQQQTPDLSDFRKTLYKLKALQNYLKTQRKILEQAQILEYNVTECIDD